MNDLFGIGCSHEVYDTIDEEAWVSCSVEKAQIVGIVVIAIVIVIVLIFIFYNSIYGVKLTVFIVGMALIAAAIYHMRYGAENLARRRFRRTNEAIEAEMRNFNLTRNIAATNYIKEVQKERDHALSVRVQIIASITTFVALALSMGVISSLYSDWKGTL
jgi:hypothetical protein